MYFWYKIREKPRGRWRRSFQFGFTLNEEELSVNPDFSNLNLTSDFSVWTDAKIDYGYKCRIEVQIAKGAATWGSSVRYILHEDREAAIAFAFRFRDKLLERIEEARAIEPEEEVYEVLDSENIAVEDTGTQKRRIKLVS